MATEPHESIELEDFQIVDFSVENVCAFEDKWDALELRRPWSALVHLPCDDGQVPALHRQDKGVVEE